MTSNPAAKMGLRKSPLAFTVHGLAMLSSVLRRNRAVQVNIAIAQTFARFPSAQVAASAGCRTSMPA